ncbi:uncharacterized protein, partial [Littorina saxatilis]|uniref:uncharacterized protein n=1 Tax=Littorina saxatilis TaxID=31220 RepID=UPI0038B6682F
CIRNEFILENPDHSVSYSKFSQLKPKSTKATQHNKLKTCRCEYCMKVELRLKGINKFLALKGFCQLTLANKDAALDMTLCARTKAFHQSNCVERKCGSCGVTALSAHFQPVLVDHGESPATWEIWSNVTEEYRQNDGTLRSTKKWKPVAKERPFKDLVSELEDEMKTFSLHLFQARWQHYQFSQVKDNLPDNWLVLVSDFGQNFTCHHQDEIQGAHWCRSEATIHPTVAYYKKEGKVVRHSFVFISNDLKHDAHAVHHFQMKVTNKLLSEGLSFVRKIHFSDGCASQYKGKTNIVDLSHAEEDTGILTELHYFGSRHGKGPCDAEIGVVKKSANLAIKRRAAVMSDARSMYLWAQGSLTRDSDVSKRTFFFVPQGEINREREERSGKDNKSLPGTKTLHALRSQALYVVTWRKRSCFCPPCRNMEGTCDNMTCGPWHVFNMQKRRGE